MLVLKRHHNWAHQAHEEQVSRKVRDETEADLVAEIQGEFIAKGWVRENRPE